ncbi:alpha/beta hydrolase family protein [Emydomyces testavorans]|uniref:Acyl-protein thioesterase 1 n=1 Tax=Emydomyces testavorans TaxID=2070801 RepID=A0AAF0IM51_9EURO|nr:alpha/beta hydrolase family protein [Emydomyces testavorans]
MVTAPFVVPALKKHTATIIMAHGLGDNGAGWMMLAQNWRRRGLFDEVSFIFPNAPTIPVTVNYGMRMPGWYDIATLSVDATQEEFLRQQDEPGILKSRDFFNSLVKEEMDKGIRPSRIVLGGFSQGGAMALITGLTSKEKLAGIFGLSCYLPLSQKIKELLPEDWPNKKTPVFMAHGNADAIVKFDFGRDSAKHLSEMGMDVEFHEYPGMGHTSDPVEIEDLEKFLMKVIPAEATEVSSEL